MSCTIRTAWMSCPGRASSADGCFRSSRSSTSITSSITCFRRSLISAGRSWRAGSIHFSNRTAYELCDSSGKETGDETADNGQRTAGERARRTAFAVRRPLSAVQFMNDDRGFLETLIGDGRSLLNLVALALIGCGAFAIFQAVSGGFLPQDVAFLGMTADQLC